MLEAQADVLVAVAELLRRQLDVEPDGEAVAFERAFVGRFHETGAAAAHHGESRVGEKARGVFGELPVGRAGLHARAAEHRHRGMDADQALGRLDELCHNAEHPPGFACGDLLGHFGQLRLLVCSHRVGNES